ncbi:MAG: HD domain-containing protein [Spirochaetaceae bacterium]|nr:HD domain-containing protein [Spirochaetaceae bacterium]
MKEEIEELEELEKVEDKPAERPVAPQTARPVPLQAPVKAARPAAQAKQTAQFAAPNARQTTPRPAVSQQNAKAQTVPRQGIKTQAAVQQGAKTQAAVQQDAKSPAASQQNAKAQAVDAALVRAGIHTGIYENGLFSVLMINSELQIVYANKQARNFFSSYIKLGRNAFFDLFGKYFTFDDVRGIRAAVLKGEGGFTWRGKAEIKSRNHPKVFTRVYVFPANITPQAKPSYWIVMFDDVTAENRTLLRSVFVSLLEASKLKDNDTGKHIVRVNYYSEALARRLFNRPGYPEVDAEFIDNIGFLAAMHDVGKIGTPDDVLNKQGPLSDWEWSVMKEHTKNGAFILSTYPNPMAKEIAQSHHEKWNGTGYPFGIDGKHIPLAARIVSIADVYDALRMKRSYKPSFTHEASMEKMIENKGTQFDPELINIFIEMAGEFNEIYEANKDTE